MRKFYVLILCTLLFVSVDAGRPHYALADIYSDICPTNLSFSRRSFDPVGGCNCPEGQGEALSLTKGVAQFGGCYNNISVAQAVIELSSLNGKNGFILNGTNTSVSNVGDINGDGIDDIIVGAMYAGPNGSNSGQASVIFGKTDWSGTPTLALSGLNGTNGFQINGIAANNRTGVSVSGAGDVNNDGYDDIIIGAYWADPNGTDSGQSYVVFGKADWSGTPAIQLSGLNGTNGFILNGVAINNQSGFSVSGAGDINKDGYDDIVIGAYNASPNGGSSGQSYVVFGKANWSGTSVIQLSGLNGTNGFTLNGSWTNNYTGYSVSSAGDINKDGYDDIIIGAYNASPGGAASGQSYVVFGKADWSGTSVIQLSGLDGTNGFKVNGAASYDFSGYSVSGAGDINKDGFDDVIIGANGASNGAGQSYVVFGKADWSGTATVALSGLNGTNGFKVSGINAYDYSGNSVSGAGDVNNDGYDDIIIGAYGAAPHGAMSGQSYVVLGKGDWSGTPAVALSGLNGTNGVKINGIAMGNYSGYSVSNVGDINNDGYDDVIIGAPSANQSYVIFGFDPTKPKVE